MYFFQQKLAGFEPTIFNSVGGDCHHAPLEVFTRTFKFEDFVLKILALGIKHGFREIIISHHWHKVQIFR
jgi:hypothetical protein